MQDEYGSGYGIRSQLEALLKERDVLFAAERAEASNEPIQWTARFVGEQPETMHGTSRRGLPVGKVEVECDPSTKFTGVFSVKGYRAWASHRSTETGTPFAGLDGWIKAQDWVEQE